MGLRLSRAQCLFGFQGVALDPKTNLFCGFILTTGEVIGYDGVQRLPQQIIDQKRVLVTPGHFLHSIRLETSSNRSSHEGKMHWTDTAGQHFSCGCHVSNYTSNPEYQISFSPPQPHQASTQMLTRIGLGLDSQGNTIFEQMQTSMVPQFQTLTFKGNGCIGWIENKQGNLVGFISDGGETQFLDEKSRNPNSFTPHYFRPSSLLSWIKVDQQQVWFHSNDQLQYQSRVLSSHSRGCSGPLPSDEHVIRSLNYLLIPSEKQQQQQQHQQEEQDFPSWMLLSAETGPYQKPITAFPSSSYEEEVFSVVPCPLTSNLPEPFTVACLLSFLIVVALLGLFSYNVYRSFIRDKVDPDDES